MTAEAQHHPRPAGGILAVSGHASQEAENMALPRFCSTSIFFLSPELIERISPSQTFQHDPCLRSSKMVSHISVKDITKAPMTMPQSLCQASLGTFCRA